MAKEWRLSVDFTDHRGVGGKARAGRQARKVLRGQFGGDVVITADKGCVFLYTKDARVAREAELAARQVLAGRGASADVRLDRWDPADQVWRDVRSSEPDLTAEPPDRVGSFGHPFLSSEMAEALANMITGGLDFIGMIP